MIRCDAVSYMEWSPQDLLEFSLTADDPASILPVWDVYPQVRNDDPLAGGAPRAGSLPNREWRTYPALMDSTAAARMRLLRLTPRERIVLARAAAGETNTVIARALFVSPGTVRKHLEHIYEKLEVHTRAEAAAIYTQERVVMESA